MSYPALISYIKEKYPRAGMAILDPTNVCGDAYIYGCGTVVRGFSSDLGHVGHSGIIEFVQCIEQYYDVATPLYTSSCTGYTKYKGVNLVSFIATPIHKLTTFVVFRNEKITHSIEIFAEPSPLCWRIGQYLDMRWNERKTAADIAWQILPQPIAEEIAEYL